MKTYFLFILLLLFAFNSYGKVITGIVIDSESEQPIPFANISIKDYAFGTISNSSGYFSINIPDDYIKKTLVVSFIGYSTIEYNIAEINEPLDAILQPVATRLLEVTINPDSTIYTFLKKIYKKIPENYPVEPSMLIGFFREATTKPNGEFLYIAEALTRSYKTSYRNKEIGQVEIIKSRKNISPARDSILGRLRYYGGLYIPHYSDAVHQKYSFIKPSGFKSFNYNYKGITSFNNEQVHVFEFCEKDSTKNKYTTGSFYVQTKDLAYVYIDIIINGNWQNELGSIYYSSSRKKILYNKNEHGKWVLKSIIRKSSAYNKATGQNYNIVTDYVVTQNTTNLPNSINYNKQVQITDIISDFANEYDPKYWCGVNVLEADSVLKQHTQHNKLSIDSQAFMEKSFKKNSDDILLQTLKKINSELGIYYNHYNFEVDKVMMVFEGNTLNTDISDNALNFGYYVILGYKFGKHLSINYTSYESLNKTIYTKKNQFGLEYLVCLKPGGRQFFALPSARYSYGYSGYGLGEIKLAEDTKFEDETFNSDVKIYSGQKKQDILLGLKLQTSLNPMINLVLGVDYSIPIQNNHCILVRESKGLIKNSAYQPFNDDIEYYEDGVLKTKSSYNLNNWCFNLGIRVSF